MLIKIVLIIIMIGSIYKGWHLIVVDTYNDKPVAYINGTKHNEKPQLAYQLGVNNLGRGAEPRTIEEQIHLMIGVRSEPGTPWVWSSYPLNSLSPLPDVYCQNQQSRRSDVWRGKQRWLIFNQKPDLQSPEKKFLHLKWSSFKSVWKRVKWNYSWQLIERCFFV